MQHPGWGPMRAEQRGENHFPWPSGNSAFCAAQDAVGFLLCEPHSWLMSCFSSMRICKSFSSGLVSITSPHQYWYLERISSSPCSCTWACWTSWGSHGPSFQFCLCWMLPPCTILDQMLMWETVYKITKVGRLEMKFEGKLSSSTKTCPLKLL